MPFEINTPMLPMLWRMSETMDDYIQVRKKLESMTNDEFESFLGKLGHEIIEYEDEGRNVKIVQVIEDGEAYTGRYKGRTSEMDSLLAARENSKPFWNEICYKLGIHEEQKTPWYKNWKILAPIGGALALILSILQSAFDVFDKIRNLFSWK